MSDAVIIAMIGGVVSLFGIGLGGFINYRIGKIHMQINSRMDELLRISNSESKAEGVIEGKAQQRKDGQQTADAVVQTIKDDPDIDLTKK